MLKVLVNYMRAVVQQVSFAKVQVKNHPDSIISEGILVYLAVAGDDDIGVCKKMAEKLINLRIFEDKNGKMNLSLKQVKGDLMLVSQFTLYGDSSSGNRPSFIKSAKAEKAKKFYFLVEEELKKSGLNIKTGVFKEQMNVSSNNVGPKTIIINI